jgi:hypothetical protein
MEHRFCTSLERDSLSPMAFYGLRPYCWETSRPTWDLASLHQTTDFIDVVDGVSDTVGKPEWETLVKGNTERDYTGNEPCKYSLENKDNRGTQEHKTVL